MAVCSRTLVNTIASVRQNLPVHVDMMHFLNVEVPHLGNTSYAHTHVNTYVESHWGLQDYDCIQSCIVCVHMYGKLYVKHAATRAWEIPIFSASHHPCA